MKAPISLFLFCLLSSFAQCQPGCKICFGDFCKPKSNNINIRSSPELADNILGVITDQTYIAFTVWDVKPVNGFLHVLIHDYSGMGSIIGGLAAKNITLAYFDPKDSEGNSLLPSEKNPDSIALGWVSLSLVEFIPPMIIYPQPNSFNISVWDKQIDLLENLSNDNRCLYSAKFHADLLIRRGQQNSYEEHYKEAIADFGNAIRITGETKDREYFEAVASRAYAKYLSDDYYGAIEDYNFLAQNKAKTEGMNLTEGNTEEQLFYRGCCYFYIADYSKALQDFNKLILINNGSGAAYYMRGMIKDNQNDKAGCCRDLSKAYDLGFEKAYNELNKRCK